MERVWTAELARRAGQQVRLQGWLHHFRRLSNVSFLLLRDARGIAQVVVDDPNQVTCLDRLHHESVLEVVGTAVEDAQAPGGIEVRKPAVAVLAEAAGPLPVEIHRPALQARLPAQLDHASIALRHPRRRALFRLTAASVAGFRESLKDRGFVEIHTPKIVAAATEGGANVFPIDYLGRRAYLAQSPQLYKQVLVGVFERVFEVGPAFRAEPHDTPRHLNEFVSLDVEQGFVEDHTTVMATLRDVLAGMADGARAEAESLALLGLEMPAVPAEIPAISFVEALERISRATGEDVTEELDLAPAHEEWLGRWVREEHGSEFLFVTGYPMAKRPFYTHPDPRNPALSNSFDLIFRGLELVTGGQRLHRYQDYLDALGARGMDPSAFDGYLSAFRYGMPPHGGFAIGLGRWTARLTGAANLRETELFPRDLSRLTP